MNKNLRWKAVLIFSVIALSVWSFYPPSQKVSLGLDLKGGVVRGLRTALIDVGDKESFWG